MRDDFNMAITPTFRRRLNLGVAVIAALVVVRLGLSWFLAYYMNLPAVCDQPCRVTDTSCSPLELKLEMKEARARVKKIPRIWYRASVRNVSCGTCRVDAGFFYLGESAGIDQANREGFYFQISDEAGNTIEVPTGSHFNDGSFGVYGTTKSASSYTAIFVDKLNSADGVEPYAIDESIHPEIFKKADGSRRFELKSGAKLASLPSKYWPNRMQTVGVQTKEYSGTATARVPVHLDKRIAPEPPAGFRLLERLVFLRSGRYRVQLAYNGMPFAGGQYRFEALPKPIASGLLRVYVWLGLPEHHLSRNWDIHAESAPLEILVDP